MAKKMIFLLIAIFLISCAKGGTDEQTLKENAAIIPAKTGVPTDTLRLVSVNLSVGWRAEDLLLKELRDSAVVYKALQDLHAQYISSQAPARMVLVAQQILAENADVVALQETQVMKIGDTVAFSFGEAVLSALDSLGGAYRIAASQELNRLNLDVSTSDGRMDLDFWEGNIILVRDDITVLDRASGEFSESLDFDILGAPTGSVRGWVRAGVQTKLGAYWQLWNTHLEVELLASTNLVQGQEFNLLLWDAWSVMDTGAQIVAGDLNSKIGKGGVSALSSENTGLVDLWSATGASDEAGFSCCIASFQDPVGAFNRRIDYLLGRNLAGVASMRTIALGSPMLWGSDHAMLSAILIQSLDHPE